MEENISFEKSLSELEKIVAKLENEDCSLSEAIELFENGVKLTKNCTEQLNSAKLKIEMLTGEDSDE
ncbi:MAG: exodeoxyribonuclease VII small subunit [Ruminococcaceae bacterium]|nr:exodeoxyribonuclease VII small subunit [Oscillospiraceae bacterium]